MRRFIKGFASLSIFLAFAPMFAQTGMKYQAVIRDGAGNLLISTAIDFQISIYNDMAGTVVLFQEDHATSTSANGVIDIEIGAGINTGVGINADLLAIDWSLQRFLNVKYSLSSVGVYTDLGTSTFNAVPYAFYALKTGQEYNLSGLSNVDTSGIAIGQTLIWNGSNWTPGLIDTVLFADSSDFANFSDTAIVALDCINCAADSANYSNQSDSSNYSIYSDSAAYANSSTYSDTATYALNSLNAWDLNGNLATASNYLGTTDSSDLRIITNSVERMIIKSDGRIGIGTNSPVLDFDIVGNNGFSFQSPIGAGSSQSFTGDRMVWYPKKAHFYSGGGSVGLNDLNIGDYTFGTGYNTRPTGDYSMAIGYASLAAGDYSFAGGFDSKTYGNYSFSFGYASQAYGIAAVAMGRLAVSNGSSSVALGYHPRATGAYSVALGYHCRATDTSSYALGYGAQSNHKGSFVFSDASSLTALTSTAPNQFLVRVEHGAKFYSSSDLSTGVELPSGGGAWSTLSDSTMKKNIVPVDGKYILDKLRGLPVYEWSYKAQHDSIIHIGPMSQDFMNAFRYGESDRMISTVDIDGVNMAALKELIKKQEYLQFLYEKRIQQLEYENSQLEYEKKYVWEKVP